MSISTYVNCEDTLVNYDHEGACWGLGTAVISLYEDLGFSK